MRGAHPPMVAAVVAALALGCEPVSAQRAATFRLENGLEVSVVEDRRAPIVTHFIGYRAGGADDPEGQSGVAHFVEHLMFSATPETQGPPYSAQIARLGGRSNAITAHDTTLYHARVPKEHLRVVMAREAGRMSRLEVTEKRVEAERDVILAERRSRIDSRPFAALIERADAALGAPYYARPSIGIAAEIATIGVSEAAAFHRRHYAPGNAFVVVVGDVTADAVRALAQETYGSLPPAPAENGKRAGTHRFLPPEDEESARRVQRIMMRDPRVKSATLYRAYHVPGYATASAGEAEAMEILSAILTSGRASRLATRIAVAGHAVNAVDGGYLGVRRQGGQLAIYVVAAMGADLVTIETAIDDAIAHLANHPPGIEEVDEARRTLVNQQAFRADDQFLLAQFYAEGLGVGLTTSHSEGFAERLARVGPEQIRSAARLLRERASTVTAILAPMQGSSEEAGR